MLRKENISRKKQRFSIKKISGKTVSVLIGFTILGVLSIGTPDAKADSVNNILNKTDNSLKEYINTGSSGTLAKVNEEATQTSSTTASSETKVNEEVAQTSSTTASSETKVNEEAAQTSSTTASSETKVNEEVAQTSSTTASSETKVNEEATQISSMSRFKRSLLNLNITDRNSNEVTSPTITSADRKSKIQIGGTSPKKEEDTTLVTMTLTFKSYSKNLHINNLPIQINGVDDTSEGATKFHTGIKDITLTPQGTSYVVYIVSKTTGKDDYVLTNDNVVILPTEIDDGYVAYVKSKSTGKDGSGLTSNIVVEVAEVPVLNSSANKGIIVRKNWVIPTAKNYLENVSDIPNSDTARWKTVIDTKKVGKQTDYITVTYPGAINSWTIGTNADYDSKQVNFEITDADNLRDTISASATERRTDNYLNSDSDKKSDFDKALKNATSVFSNDQSTQAQIDAATKQLTSAKEQLNGDEKKKALATAKDEANKAIEAMPNLSKEDKSKAETAVNNATDNAGVDTAKANAQALDTAKDEANKAINALENLNDAQKQGALAAVTAATTVDEVTTAKNTATGLDQDMGQLKDEVADDSDLRDSVNYKNADQEKQAAYDEAVSAAKAILAKDGKNEASPEVKNAQAAVKAAKKALNGDTKLATAKDEANKAIEAMPNLSKEDKSKAETAVNNATDNAGVDTAKANAQALPQTGDEDNSTLSLLGVVLLTIASVLSFSGVRKKENK